MSDYFESSFLKKLSLVVQNNDPIEQDLYQKYDVRRGLRYLDGRGVLVGLTLSAMLLAMKSLMVKKLRSLENSSIVAMM